MMTRSFIIRHHHDGTRLEGNLASQVVAVSASLARVLGGLLGWTWLSGQAWLAWLGLAAVGLAAGGSWHGRRGSLVQPWVLGVGCRGGEYSRDGGQRRNLLFGRC